MSLIPANMPFEPWLPDGLYIVLFSIVTLLGLPLRLTPSPSMSLPELMISLPLTVTFEPVTSM